MSRRELLVGGAAAGVSLALQRAAIAATPEVWTDRLDFESLPPGKGWPGWGCAGVANLRRASGQGLLEAGSDVFPCDPRPVAFALDRRFRDGEISARLTAAGAGAGLVLRRIGPRQYYAAIYDDEGSALVLVRRSGSDLKELGRVPARRVAGPLRLTFKAEGPVLSASLEPGTGLSATISARDATPELQQPGDPGVLATARTLFPSKGPPVLPALGNLHLLPWGVQEGQAVMHTAVGERLLETIRERSTAAFREITLRASGRAGVTAASVVAATSGTPFARGATLRVAADVPARVEVEVSTDPAFHAGRRLAAGSTDSFDAVIARASDLPPGRRVYWRARLRRHGRETVGPTRSLRVLPEAGSGESTKVAVGACAAQFGPVFEQIAERRPDAFVWQGDLNYPDTVGPLAQTMAGYAGIWRDFLANPRMSQILDRTPFAAQRDDHDYGVQDANSTNLVPWGLAPWEGLMEDRLHYRFSAGLADYWVVDQRRFKSDPKAADTPEKTLLGADQREWLLRTLAASTAPFKVVCSPCTLAPLSANQRDGSWAAGFTAERDLVLDHVRKRVSGRTLFVTGDTHWTMAYDRDGLFEARPCPLGIPTPNDITLTEPQAAEQARGTPGVLYADDDRGHFALIETSAGDGVARLDLSLVREDGATPFRRRFEQPLP